MEEKHVCQTSRTAAAGGGAAMDLVMRRRGETSRTAENSAAVDLLEMRRVVGAARGRGELSPRRCDTIARWWW
jgi:hypothetical protein